MGSFDTCVQVVYGMLVECGLLLAIEDMWQARRVGEAEYAVAGRACQYAVPEERNGITHSGCFVGEHTIAMLSGSMI